MIELVEGPIQLERLYDSAKDLEAGGVVHFVGTVRNDHGIRGLFYECYTEMAKKILEQIAAEARQRWSLKKVGIVHRTGWVPVGEASVAIAVAAVHRQEAFLAGRFVIEQIKSQVPIWKKGEKENT